MLNNTTIVTGLWDLGRSELNPSFKRNFEDYKNRFFELISSDIPMCIWIPKDLEYDVLKIRGDLPTKVFIRELSDFETWNPFFNEIETIRKNENWKNQVGWLSESPQAALKYYNPMMFTKMFMVNDSAIVNPFNTEYFFWIDGGITNTVNKGYFQHDKVFNNLENYCKSYDDKLIHISYPYEGASEVHGFERNSFAKFCNIDFVRLISRGGFFGGKKNLIHELNNKYYSIMETTLKEGFMGADECLFTILAHTNQDKIHRFQIEGNGLVWPFFEELKNYKNIIRKNKVGLYVVSYNSPKQFETLVESIIKYDKNFIDKTEKILLNNSTKRETDLEYAILCEKYGFEEVKKNNIGICGGRQWCAEHSEQNDFEYHFFFEDDMFFYLGDDEFCKNGFRRKLPNFYNSLLEIMKKENFDFLKWNFTEFFGDNSKQWAWHNVPPDIRRKLFPDNPEKTSGDVNLAPNANYKNIKSHNSIPYATGEIYYCNWPQIVSKEGNKKMFLTIKWDHPYEQTWMSYMYQETLKNNIFPGILLATPTEHNRFEFYSAEERREN